jgi:hypothetical protein
MFFFESTTTIAELAIRVMTIKNGAIIPVGDARENCKQGDVDGLEVRTWPQNYSFQFHEVSFEIIFKFSMTVIFQNDKNPLFLRENIFV